MQRTTIDFGIDLGTTNSTIAVIDDIDAKVIPNKVGSSITPSAVWIDKRGGIHVGQEAKLRALIDDRENGDLEFKLRMGLGSKGKKVFQRSRREMLPEELSAEVLKSLKMDVQTNMGEQLRVVVITVPAAFENPQNTATMKAAQLAGFALSPLLLEPVAASLAYGFQSESENVYWMVYDFGGGTFDAALMRIRDGLIQVVHHDGDNHLGGKLLDWDIVDKKLATAVREQFSLSDFNRGVDRWKAAFGKMKYHAEQAKIDVCRSRAPYEIWIEGLCTKDTDGIDIDFAYTLTPEDVQQISRPYIERSLNLCRKTLEHEGMSGANLERILMVGGTTLNPWVREAVQAELGGKLEYGIDPVTVVARGAAIFASAQTIPDKNDNLVIAPKGIWCIQIEHNPVGNVPDPDIGGRVIPPDGGSIENYTIRFVDTRTHWRSGLITLGSNGVFMTQLYAEKHRRHEYEIELCDPTGTRVPTSPDRVAYTIGVIPEDPPAAWSIGVGQASGKMAIYVKKGTKIPPNKLRKSMDYYTTVSLRAEHKEDELHIPIREGEHPLTERNHEIGELIIRGSDIRRDLPAGSQIEIELIMDQSQQVQMKVYVTSLDEEFEAGFDSNMKHDSLEDLIKEAERQKNRLKEARGKAERTDAPKAKATLSRIERQQLVDHIDSLISAAGTDEGAVPELDRRLRELAAAVDEIDDAVEWPILLENVENLRKEVEGVVEQYPNPDDRKRLDAINKELQKAIDACDPELLRRCREDLETLYLIVLERQPGFHVARFNWLGERTNLMRDPARAEQIIAQGRRAINTNDLLGLKAANRQLFALLPVEVQPPRGIPSGVNLSKMSN